MKNIPIILILFRFILAPVILALVYFYGESAKPIVLLLMYLGLISDILDGIIARKQNLTSRPDSDHLDPAVLDASYPQFIPRI